MKLDWKQLVAVLGPLVLANVKHGDKIAPLVPTIVHGITEAEGIKGATGAEKKAHVLIIANDAVTAINSVKGATVLDPIEMHDAVAHGIDTVVATVNLVHKANPPSADPS